MRLSPWLILVTSVGFLPAIPPVARADEPRATGAHPPGKAVPQLTAALKDKDWQVRRDAAAALGESGPAATAAVPALVAALKDIKPVWDAAVAALGQIGPSAREAIPALRAEQKRPFWWVRASATVALAKIVPTPREAVDILLAALKDPEPQVRSAAVGAIRELGSRGRDAVPVLLDALSHPNKDVRVGLALALARIGSDTRDLDLLGTAMQVPDEAVLRVVVDALGEMGSAAAPAVPLLAEGLKAPNADVRLRAVTALGKIGAASPETVPTLFTALNDADARVRGAAVDALGEIGAASGGTLPALVTSLKDADARVRYSALAAIGQQGLAARDALPVLIVALDDSDDAVRRQAWTMLERLRPALPKEEPRLVAFDALRKDLTELQGVWRLESLEVDGRALTLETPFKELRWKVAPSGRRLLITPDPYGPYSARIDPTKEPKEVDFDVPASPLSGESDRTSPATCRGIYALTGDTCRLCYGLVEDDKRPTEFSAKAGGGRVLAVLRREKP
jgi:uncharacterized protein (TIGR03067 family)